MNAFASYAQEAIPLAQQRRQAKQEKAPSALDLKMAEKQRLSKLYRAWQRDERKRALTDEPRLRDFMRYLRKVTADDGDDLLDAIRTSWLPAAAQHVRIMALRLVDRRANQLIREAGGEPLNDPVDGTTVYFEARAILHPGGKL